MIFQTKLPTQVQFFLPVIDELRKMGGSSSPSELKKVLVEKLGITKDELDEKQRNGDSRIDNQIISSKKYLIREKLIDTSNSNIWILTAEGLSRNLAEDDVLRIFRLNRKSSSI